MKIERYRALRCFAFSPETWLEHLGVWRKKCQKLSILRPQWYVRHLPDKPLPFALEQALTYSGTDSFVQSLQRRNRLILKSYYNREWICIKDSPMSYPIADFQPLISNP